MHVDLQNIPACAIFLIKSETVYQQVFERDQPTVFPLKGTSGRQKS